MSVVLIAYGMPERKSLAPLAVGELTKAPAVVPDPCKRSMRRELIAERAIALRPSTATTVTARIVIIGFGII